MTLSCKRVVSTWIGIGIGVLLWCVTVGPARAQTPAPATTPTITTTAAPAPTSEALQPPAGAPTPNRLAEQWVAAQIAAGQTADLAQRFPSEAERVLSAAFLQDLLTRPLSDTVAARHGVRIASAVVSDTLDLHNAVAPTEVWLIGCRFGGPVDLSQSRWAANLDLSSSRFMSPVSLRAARIEGAWGLVKTTFEGTADFGDLAVGLDWIANQVQFTAPAGRSTFDRMHIGGSAFLTGALFAGPTTFTAARITGEFSADQARFTNTRSGASFSRLKVDGSLALYEAEFDGPADFIDVEVGRNLMGSQARFTDTAVGANFSSMRVGGYAFFRRSTFAGRADFGRMEVGLDFDVGEVQFTHPEQEAAFNTMKIGGYAAITKAVFAGPTDFIYTSVGLDFNADGARFTNPSHGPNFGEMKVGGYAYFTDVVFAGPATFSRMNVGVDFAMVSARFEHPEEDISFASMKVGGYASFSKTYFAGSVNLGVSPALGLQADEAQFPNPRSKAVFNDLQTPGYVFIINSVFTAPVEFVGAHIGGDFLANGARFANPDKGASFVSMQVGGSVFMHDAAFAGPMDFHHTSVGLNLELDGTKFNARRAANFGNFKVGGIASFPKTEFDGPAIFVGGDVRGQFILDGARFNYDDQASAMFDGLVVGETVLMRGVTFAAPVSMADVTFLDINLEGTGDSPQVLPQLDLSRAVIKRQLLMANLRFPQGWVAPSLQVLGRCVLHDLTVEKEVSLEQASLQTLVLTHVTWPTDTRQVRLDGITYQNINAGTNPNAWETLLDWANHAAYSADVYTNLEQYYRKRGYPEQADAIFITEKRRERAETLGGPSSVSWWWNLILDGFVVYGRRPGRAFVWAAIIVAFGTVIFRRRYMEPLKPEYADHVYSPFWYSLDLFVPVLDLLAANRWTVRREYWLVRNYLRLHALLGWLLIPIGLAALSGIIK